MSQNSTPWLDPMHRFRMNPVSPFALPASDQAIRDSIDGYNAAGLLAAAPRLDAPSSMSSLLAIAAMRAGTKVFSFDIGVSADRLMRQLAIQKAFEVDVRVYRRDLDIGDASRRIYDAQDAGLVRKGAAQRKLKRLKRRKETSK